MRNKIILLLSIILIFSQIGQIQSACDAQCKTCAADETTCEVCNDKFFLEANACKGCSELCANCNNSATTCTSCPETGMTFLNATDKVCYASCVDGYFTSGKNCLVCDTICKTCDKAGECKSCKDGTFLSGTACNNCSDTCSTCSTVANNCTACNDTTKFLQVDQGTCLSACADGYYPNEMKCLVCDNSCSKCEKAMECTICKAEKLFNVTSKLCVDSCTVDGYFKSGANCDTCNETCLTCDEKTKCKTCKSGFFLKEDDLTCVSACGDGFYLNGTTCKKCDSLCATCENGLECLTCVGILKFLSDTKKCIESCPEEKYVESTDGTKCLRCGDKCKACNVLNQTICSSCTTEGILQGDKCLASCTTGFYNSTSTMKCEPCSAGCSSCLNATNCTTCGEKFFKTTENITNVLTDICNLKCINQVDVLGQRICVTCANVTEPGAGANDTAECTACSPGYSLSGGLCFRCKNFTGPVKVGETYECKRCLDNNCVQCSNANASDTTLSMCLTCSVGYFVNETTKACSKCPDNCTACHANQTCTSCMNPTHVLNNGTCVSYPCRENQYFISAGNINFDQRCQNCLTNCLVCDRFDSQICKVCNGSLVFDSKLKSCVSPLAKTEIKCGLDAYLEVDGSCVCKQSNYYYSQQFGCRKILNESCDSCYIDQRDQCTAFSFIPDCQPGCLVQQNEKSTTCMLCRQSESYDIDNDTRADIIPTPQYLDSQGKCQKCKEGCKVCTNEYGCRECLPNFMMTKIDAENVTCAAPVAVGKLCQDGYLPSVASIFYLNMDVSNLDKDRSKLYDYSQFNTNLFTRTGVSNATGIFGEPLLTGSSFDESKNLFYYNETTKKVLYSYYIAQQSQRFFTTDEITVECLPCEYNCDSKCAPNYFYHSDSQRCFLKCPDGWKADTTTTPRSCQKVTSDLSVMIRSTQLGSGNRFVNSGFLNVEAVITDFSTVSAQSFSGYSWTVTPLNAPFPSQFELAKTMVAVTLGGELTGGVALNKRTLSIPSTLLLPGVTYQLEVTFQATGSRNFKASRSVSVLPASSIISFESQGLPVNQIQLSKSVVQSGQTVNFTYALNEVKLFQNSTWRFMIHADWIDTQISDKLSSRFLIQAPYVEDYTNIELRFDATDGVVTYRVVRQLAVEGISNSTSNIFQALDIIKGLDSLDYTSNSYLQTLPQLLTNLKRFAYVNQSREMLINNRVWKDTFLDEGACLSNDDCGGGLNTCILVNSTTTRRKCSCGNDMDGGYCQLNKVIYNKHATTVQKILIKVSKYLNKTQDMVPMFRNLQDMSDYMTIANQSFDFIDINSTLAYTYILQKLASNAWSTAQIAMIEVLERQIYNSYWNTYKQFEDHPDKSLQKQLENMLYNISRAILIQKSKTALTFQNKEQPISRGKFMNGKILYKETVGDLKTTDGFMYNFTNSLNQLQANVTYNYTMVKDVQLAGLLVADVNRDILKNSKGANLTIGNLYKVTAVDLSSQDQSELKRENVEYGVTLFFFNLRAPKPNTKRTCAFYNDTAQEFVLDRDGTRGCKYIAVNKTVNNEQVVDDTVAQCICTHNTIYSVGEYSSRTTPRQYVSASSILTITFLTTILYLILVLF